MPPIHINPDFYLETANGRVITPERNTEAWARCHAALADALRVADPATRVYVLIGPQGAGKTTWGRACPADLDGAILFDAILVKRVERAPILAAAAAHGVAVVAVWFRTPVDVCIARNAARPPDQVVPEQAIRNVHAAIEPPALEEGFERVIEVLP